MIIMMMIIIIMTLTVIICSTDVRKFFPQINKKVKLGSKQIQTRQKNLQTFELQNRKNFVKELQKMTGTGMSDVLQ